jgi:hypothetical protein
MSDKTLYYASGQQCLPEPVLEWDDWVHDGTEYSKAHFIDPNIRLYVFGTRWRLSRWSIASVDYIEIHNGVCSSREEGKLRSEAALRKYCWDSLMPRGTDL